MLDKVIIFPVFWYVSEIAGYENLDILKMIDLRFCK
jgi:hypothetical protein